MGWLEGWPAERSARWPGWPVKRLIERPADRPARVVTRADGRTVGEQSGVASETVGELAGVVSGTDGGTVGELVIEQIGVTESSLPEIQFGVDFRRLGQYADKSRKNVFIIRNNGKWEKRNVFLKSQRCCFNFYKARRNKQCGF